jgi:hypothetical protein
VMRVLLDGAQLASIKMKACSTSEATSFVRLQIRLSLIESYRLLRLFYRISPVIGSLCHVTRSSRVHVGVYRCESSRVYTWHF